MRISNLLGHGREAFFLFILVLGRPGLGLICDTWLGFSQWVDVDLVY